MTHFEYKVVAAPTKGVKARGVKSAEARFSHMLEQLMNEMAADGWEYQRAETLPSVERSGLTSTTTHWRNVLVFRRVVSAVEGQQWASAPALAAAATSDGDVSEPTLTSQQEPRFSTPQTPDDDASHSEGAARMLQDNGVEEISDVAGVTRSLKQLVATRSTNKSDG
ncbi:MAG: DUF4177 domain-containing protein [Pseudomonadota bacterium]